MGVTWTEEQKQVITLRNRNLLVSAAAGSGKTAVLVERIVQKVLDQEHPADIDRMLVVTFTKAAAAEMRERVGQAIEKRMEEEPENSRLQRQATLVHNAQITTIDSFCLYVVRNYFQTIGLEPSFRIADPGELQLLKADVAARVMEQHYQEKPSGFLQLADRYATAKSDAVLEDFMIRLYDFAQSQPWPEEWLKGLPEQYQINSEEQLNAQKWMEGLLKYAGHVMADLKKQMEYAEALCADDDGPQMYLAAVQDDVRLLEELCACSTYEQYADRLMEIRFTKLGINRKYEGSEEKKERVKELRGTMKDTVGKIQKAYFYQDSERMLSDIEKILPDVEALAELAMAFSRAYQAEKQEKNLLDFSDIEHFALKILVDEKTKETSAAARELRETFEEVMIDEYQDSNLVQETILKAVSREEWGQNNIFMVGDVKQSIYRFRLARPQLFIDKYDTYSEEESSQQKISLSKNFRSRKEAVDSINWIFYKIMHKDLGNVEYDDHAALHAAASYPEPDSAGVSDSTSALDSASEEYQGNLFKSELLIAQASKEELAEGGFADWQELEARMTAARIRELLETQLVTDKESGKLRPVRCRDIVILLRSMTGWADTFSKVLTESGIPAYTASRTGYFNTVEIQTILSMLSILDNPLQDIPLAAVLASPIGGMNGEELAEIKTASKEHFYFLALEEYAEYGADRPQKLRKKAVRFLDMYRKLRRLTAFTPVHKLIHAVLKETGYDSYIQAMPAGEQRRANVDMLLEKAVAYEKTSYKGLFHFVRYIEQLKKYEVDFGEADITSENEDVVRIMSIHKSKGLEFPVVFVCGMGKQFNRQDIRSRLILHPDYGIGLDYIDADKRIKKPGFIKKVLENEIGVENQGEELRVLYVALTRAKEKLIMTGAVKEELKPAEAFPAAVFSDSAAGREESKPAARFSDGAAGREESKPAAFSDSAAGKEEPKPIAAFSDSTADGEGTKPAAEFLDSAAGGMDYFARYQASSYLDWVYPCVAGADDLFQMRVYHTDDLKIQEAIEEAVNRLDERQVQKLYRTADQKLYKELDRKLSWQYPFASDTDLKTKISVTELKHRQQMVLEEEAPAGEEWFARERESIIPAFLKSKDETSGKGALRGSAVHKVMEETDFVRIAASEDRTGDMRAQIQSMLERHRITQDMKELASLQLLRPFLNSLLVERMAQAQRRGELHREQPFVMGIPASRVYEGASEELVLIQGIVDVYWIEDGELVILDYKTDAVKQAEELVRRYRTQLELYGEALQKATGRKVKEKVMYSFALQGIVAV